MNEKRNLAARAGRWSTQHRKKAIIGWLVFVVLAVFVGGSFGTNTLKDDQSGVGESGRLTRSRRQGISRRGLRDRSSFRARTDPARTTRRSEAAVADVMHRVDAEKGVKDIESPYAKGNEGQLSPDGRSALVTFDLPGDDDDREARGRPAGRGQGSPQAPRRARGSRSSATPARTRRSTRRSRTTSEGARSPRCRSRLIILILAFGALLAAFVPLLLAITAVAAADRPDRADQPDLARGRGDQRRWSC